MNSQALAAPDLAIQPTFGVNDMIRKLCGVAILASLSMSEAIAEQPPAAFAACSACHSSDGANGVGPL